MTKIEFEFWVLAARAYGIDLKFSHVFSELSLLPENKK